MILEGRAGGRRACPKRHAPYAPREGVEHEVVNDQLKDGGDAERKAMLDGFVAGGSRRLPGPRVALGC